MQNGIRNLIRVAFQVVGAGQRDGHGPWVDWAAAVVVELGSGSGGFGRWRFLQRVVDFALNFLRGAAELGQPFADGAGQFRQPFAAEQQQHDHQNQQDFGGAEIHDILKAD